ncbi:MAG: glycosyltransferase family 2 protein [Bacteroidia bacterium]
MKKELRPYISIVSPVYGAEKLLDALVERIGNSMKQITESYEIILVEDHSPDRSWEKIEENARLDSRIKGVKLSRNYGQHYAITAGLDHSSGKWVVVMDCDLQDRPEEIINLYNKAQEGWDVVLARRYDRQDGRLKKWFSRSFYKVLSYLTGSSIDPSIANFGIYHKNVVESICSMRESIRYFPSMVKWVGFNSTSVNVKHAERAAGSSGYNFGKLLKLAVDIMLAYSDKPLLITVQIGILISMFSFVAAIVYFIMAVTGKIQVMGFASLIVSIWFLSGLIILTLGIMGLYIGKTFEGVKNRPIYLVAKRVNVNEAEEEIVLGQKESK